jgi:citrate synthase
MNIQDSKTAKSAKGAAKPSATLTVDNKQVDLSVRSGSIGPDVIDVANLYKETGCFTYDPGFTSTANCSSKITYIDGDKGELLRSCVKETLTTALTP